MSNYDHLDYDNTEGWGFLPKTPAVFQCMEYVRDHIKPKRMLEIGYYKGQSTSYWAEHLPDCEIISCCPNHNKFRATAKGVEKRYPNVTVYPISSPAIYDVVFEWGQFDFAFIDGDHSSSSVIFDLAVAKNLNIPWIMLDNTERVSVQKGIKRAGGTRIKMSWDYECTHKGKTAMNSMSLYHYQIPTRG